MVRAEALRVRAEKIIAEGRKPVGDSEYVTCLWCDSNGGFHDDDCPVPVVEDLAAALTELREAGAGPDVAPPSREFHPDADGITRIRLCRYVGFMEDERGVCPEHDHHDCLDVYVREDLARSPGGTEGWRPFETAPTDGREVLAYRRDAGVFPVVRRLPEPTDEYVEGEDEIWFAVGGDDISDDLPTMWHPYPAAPTEDRPEGDDHG